MLLEDEQKDLLIKFVEAHRSTPREARGPFFTVETMGSPQASFIHSRVQRLRIQGSRADAEILADAGLLRQSWNSQGRPMFYVPPEGIAYYEHLMNEHPPAKVVEDEVARYLSDDEFSKAHRQAVAKGQLPGQADPE